MRRIKGTGHRPQSYVALRAARSPFSEISSDPNIRWALWEQQHGRCAYCERSLKQPSHPDHRTRIEHFHPQGSTSWSIDCRRACGGQADDAKAPTTWDNLLLCCDGNESAGGDYTCDKSKAGTDICERFRNPKIWTASDVLVVIDPTGKALRADGMPDGAQEVVDDVLNLNAQHIVNARRRLISGFQKQILRGKNQRQGLPDAQRDRFAQGLRAQAETKDFAATYLSFADRLVNRERRA